jgi:hypothetical protein
MIPKSKRRTIVVGGDEYEYCVKGCVSIYIKNLRTGKQIRWWDEWKPKWHQEVTPEFIRELIIANT